MTRYGCRWTSDDTRVQVVDNKYGDVVAEIRPAHVLTNHEAWALAVYLSRRFEAEAGWRDV